MTETPTTSPEPPKSAPAKNPLSRRRRLAFVAATVALVAVFAEIASSIGIYFSLHAGEDLEAIALRQERIARVPRGKEDSGIVVHPFTGWAIKEHNRGRGLRQTHSRQPTGIYR